MKSPAENFDLVVIGSGSGGSTAARKCREAGWSVAVVDERPFGGTCALRGCDPKKVLVGAAETLDRLRRMKGAGVRGQAQIHWPELISFVRSFTDPVPEQRERSLRDQRIEPIQGHAQFADEHTIAVGGRRLSGGHILVASGARPAPLSFEGAAKLTLSDEFLALERLPDRILFVGGGYVSFELAHVAARAGARVTIAHRGERPLEAFDPDLVKILTDVTRELGTEVLLRTEVIGVRSHDNGCQVLVRSDEGANTALEADLVVHGAGRVPATDGLRLEAGNVATCSDGGIKVDAYLRSVSNPRVYAAGDAASTVGAALTPVAVHDSHVAAANLLRNRSRRVDYDATPSAVFTLPTLARVGLDEEQARVQGCGVKVRFERTDDWYSARRVQDRASAYKTITDSETGKLLGAHLLATGAEETINLFGQAIRQGLTAAEVKATLYSYPSRASDLPYMV